MDNNVYLISRPSLRHAFKNISFTFTYYHCSKKGTDYCADMMQANMTEIRPGQYIAPTAVDTGTEGIK